MEIVCGIFEKAKYTNEQLNMPFEISSFPKFMPSHKLLNFQLLDIKFRQTFVIQALIFLNHLLAFSSKEEFKPNVVKTSKEILLNPEMVLMLLRLKLRS